MMIEDILYDDGKHICSKLKELALQRHVVISNNIANASTPGYIRKELDFKDTLSNAIDSGDSDDIKEVQGKVVTDHDGRHKLDGNNVSIANEMMHMMQNGVLFDLVSRMSSTKMNIIKSSMKGAE